MESAANPANLVDLHRDELLKTPDTSTLSNEVIRSLYEEFKVKLNEGKPTPDFLEGLFWFVTLSDNQIQDDHKNLVDNAFKVIEEISPVRLQTVNGSTSPIS